MVRLVVCALVLVLPSARALAEVCGDGTCEPAENKLSCPSDCVCVQEALFQDDFSTDRGWTFGPEWQRGPAVSFFTEPPQDNTPTDDNLLAGTALGAFPEPYAHGSFFLTSPVVDTLGKGTVWLTFRRWLVIQDFPNAFDSIEVFDGQQWIKLWEADVRFTDDVWEPVILDLSPFLSAQTQVRFGFGIAFASFASDWSVDDVKIFVPCGGGICGNSRCDTDELCSTCSADCGCALGARCHPHGDCEALPDCGNGACNAPETCDNCGDCACFGAEVCNEGICEPCGGCPDATTCDGAQCQALVECGDGSCAGLETCANCLLDCSCAESETCDRAAGSCQPLCGNGSCDADETCTDCPDDCECCGDDKCNDDESCLTCEEDCGCQDSRERCTPAGACVTCGDGTCDPAAEDCNTCSDDCGPCCGNGIYEPEFFETCLSCPADCISECGDGVCFDLETCASCPEDCGCTDPLVCNPAGTCAPLCGNHRCDAAEDCSTCPGECPCAPGERCSDSGQCDRLPDCGNEECTAPETCANCPTDCGVCCGNHRCDASEGCANCPTDCGACAGCDDGVCDVLHERVGPNSDCEAPQEDASCGFLGTTAFSDAEAASCVDHQTPCGSNLSVPFCRSIEGHPGQNAQCSCSIYCFSEGDCCGDVCVQCPEFPGCPDFAGDRCGDNYCASTGGENCTNCPQDCDCVPCGTTDCLGVPGDSCPLPGQECLNGRCDCPASCDGSTCGGPCVGACGGCPEGQSCGATGCVAACPAGCPPGQECDAVSNVCVADPDCVPSCGGRQCGDDGCGGSCGTCGAGNACDPLTGNCRCSPQCEGRAACAADGCGGQCPPCLCTEAGSLAFPPVEQEIFKLENKVATPCFGASFAAKAAPSQESEIKKGRCKTTLGIKGSMEWCTEFLCAKSCDVIDLAYSHVTEATESCLHPPVSECNEDQFCTTDAASLVFRKKKPITFEPGKFNPFKVAVDCTAGGEASLGVEFQVSDASGPLCACNGRAGSIGGLFIGTAIGECKFKLFAKDASFSFKPEVCLSFRPFRPSSCTNTDAFDPSPLGYKITFPIPAFKLGWFSIKPKFYERKGGNSCGAPTNPPPPP